MDLENLKNKKGFFSLTPCNQNDILEAEKLLKIIFSDEFKKYTAMYGAISVNGKEITGIVEQSRLSVINNTAQARIDYKNFPKDKYVVEDIAIESCLILQDAKGNIYRYTPSTLELINTSLLDYINSN